jgi:hypothetical protein
MAATDGDFRRSTRARPRVMGLIVYRHHQGLAGTERILLKSACRGTACVRQTLALRGVLTLSGIGLRLGRPLPPRQERWLVWIDVGASSAGPPQQEAAE